jgi:ATP-binding cassette, subfamily B, bacterial PglK
VDDEMGAVTLKNKADIITLQTPLFISMNFHKTILQPLFGLLHSRDKKKGIWIVALTVLNALLDYFSLASFLPIIFLITSPDFITSNKYAIEVYTTFDFNSPVSFIVAVTFAVLIFTVIKNVISVWISKSRANFIFTIGFTISKQKLSQYLEISFLEFTKKDFTRELNRIANIPLAFYLILKKKLKQFDTGLRESYPRLLKYTLQIVEAFPEIKIFKKEYFFMNRFTTTNFSHKEMMVKEYLIKNSISRLVEVIAAVSICLLIIYSVWSSTSYQQTILALSIYATASFRMIPSLNRILIALSQIKSNEHLMEELLPTYQPSIEAITKPHLPFQHAIELNHVSFSYEAGKPPIVNTVSLTIKKGERIMVYGPSGSGKTTLVLLMAGLLKPERGFLAVDKIPVSNENRNWPDLIGYVPQNPLMLDASVSENIAFGVEPEKIDADKVWAILQTLQLHDLLNQPQGVHARINEKGISISGGQRQRLALARTLYADKEVFLLDEFTNQLDEATEKKLMGVLQLLSAQGKTIIMITHKVSLSSYFDRVFEMVEGNIAEKEK